MSSVVNELHRYRARNNSRFHTFVEEKPDRCPPTIAIVERPVVHVHPHEGVGPCLADPAVETCRMVERRLPVLQD